MTKPHDSTPSPAVPAHNPGGRWRYPFLFGVQTIGAAIFFWNAVPHYRQILADPASHEAQPETLVWSLSAIALIQAGYWIRYHIHPPLPQFGNALLGYVVQFLGRMGFVFATSVFGFVFITQKPGFDMPAFRYVVTIVGLFSLFCYTQELERLSRAFTGQERKPDAPAH